MGLGLPFSSFSVISRRRSHWDLYKRSFFHQGSPSIGLEPSKISSTQQEPTAMPEGRIYSSGREPYFNLNSTWYDPAGSWLDTRRKPFHYTENTACVCSRNRRCDIPRRGGHNYRCYGYRRSTCKPGGNPRVRSCVHNPSGGPRDYWGRPIGDSCDGNTGGHYSNEESFHGSCCGGGCGSGEGASAPQCSASGGCGGGGGSVCSEPGCRSSGWLQTSGRGVCAEPCATSTGGCGNRRGVCFEPGCHSAGGGGSCAGSVMRSSGGCRRGPGVCSEPCARAAGGC
ncbi:hypothetical protein JRQ81_009282 [Phrynocephalus forsythii]|uniref:Uncharacterized protein n=1 Tax=Phrynocephalus forsythii TaxID=171643 RepID=A0A9Q1ASC9_9SAUR|nr:hypothetical protein JRQ81_009282 [Phrynocephalus forsythii]